MCLDWWNTHQHEYINEPYTEIAFNPFTARALFFAQVKKKPFRPEDYIEPPNDIYFVRAEILENKIVVVSIF